MGQLLQTALVEWRNNFAKTWFFFTKMNGLVSGYGSDSEEEDPTTRPSCLGPAPQKDNGAVKSTEKDWMECVDSTSGYPYYWNRETNEVKWDRPSELPPISTSPPLSKKPNLISNQHASNNQTSKNNDNSSLSKISKVSTIEIKKENPVSNTTSGLYWSYFATIDT